MLWMAGLMTLLIVCTIASGVYLLLCPPPHHPEIWLKRILGGNALGFAGGLIGMMVITVSALAAPEGSEPVREFSVGLGLAFLGAGLPTALAAIAAGMAVGTIGAAALAVVAEKPEAFGRSLIFLGLAEGIAIYGLVISILMLDKL